jgi:hypothetical protein
MAYASQSGRARTSARQPRAFAVCQRCGIWYNRDTLNFQFEWRGTTLQNTYILVCKSCMDVPQQQNRAIVLPADPVPIFYPSVEDFEQDETDYRSTSQIIPPDPVTGIPIPSTTLRVTEDEKNRTLIPFGKADGLSQSAVMPYNGAVQQAYGNPLSLLSVTSNGTCTVSVTCSQPHGLQTTNQVSVAGLVYAYANGFYSVTVVTATAFTYQTYAPVPAQSLLAPTSRIITCLVGLPLGYTTIPKIYSPGSGVSIITGDVFELEDGSGFFFLEDGVTFLGLEV